MSIRFEGIRVEKGSRVPGIEALGVTLHSQEAIETVLLAEMREWGSETSDLHIYMVYTNGMEVPIINTAGINTMEVLKLMLTSIFVGASSAALSSPGEPKALA